MKTSSPMVSETCYKDKITREVTEEAAEEADVTTTPATARASHKRMLCATTARKVATSNVFVLNGKKTRSNFVRTKKQRKLPR